MIVDFGQTDCSTVVCEGTSTQLTCPNSQRVVVRSAMWGRGDARTCRRGSGPNGVNTVVALNDVTDTLRQLCDNRSRCDVTADVATFGSVQAGSSNTALYLVANYSCKGNFVFLHMSWFFVVARSGISMPFVRSN